MKNAPVGRVVPLIVAALLAGCWDESAKDSPGLGSLVFEASWSDWSEPVNLGPDVNSDSQDIEVSISKTGLSLYIASNRPTGSHGGFDIWVSQRDSVDAPWGAPQNLGATINTSANEQAPFLTIDGHSMYLFSNRPGFGGNDLYVSHRKDKNDDFGWETPVNLGGGVNGAFNETLSVFFEDDTTGETVLTFNSNRPGAGMTDIFASTLQEDGTFGAAVPVDELNSAFRDANFAIRRDGLEMFMASDRPGSIGGAGTFDLWVTTRASTTDPWSTPVNLGPAVNSAGGDSRGALSFDATTLYIVSDRDGGSGVLDIWVSTRTKLKN